MLRYFLLLSAVLAFFVASSQDFLSVPSTRPELFVKPTGASNQKFIYQRDSLVYQFDTLSLPFIDDFSEDHFPILVKDPTNDPRVTQEVYYAIRVNGQVYTDSVGFVRDTTFTYTVTGNGDTVSTIPNNVQIIQLFDLSQYPPSFTLENVYPPYHILDSLGIPARDTVLLTPTILQDSVRFYVVEKDTSSFYADRYVYRNNTMGFYPPSIGVVTFDGLNQFGLPYNFEDIAPRGLADYLTSVPIDLSGSSDSTYFSFYYQAKGLALDAPQQQDSLSLEFYNIATGRWNLAWNQAGLASGAPTDSFRYVMVRVDSQFRTKGFQFRFRNRARLSGAFDNWHVDYIYLDDNRRKTDTAQKDISFVYPATSLLKDYQAMPSWHFKTNPDAYLADSVRLFVRNNHDGPLNVFNKMVVPDPLSPPSNLYLFPGTNQFLQIDPKGDLALTYPLNFSFPPAVADTHTVLEGICDIDFRPAPVEEKDLIRSNDTVYSRAVLNNYYAYDDGTAEAGYGINAGSQGSSTSYLAVRFDMPFQDTLGGLFMYFLPQANDIRDQSFRLTVWSSLSPPTVIYQQDVRSRAIYDEKDAYIPFFFDSNIVVGPTFYIGYVKTGVLSMNLGYDMNNNNRDKIFWSIDGFNWFFPSNSIRDGSVMIRPILRKKNFGIGFDEEIQEANQWDLKPYPNPARQSFQLIDKPRDIDAFRLYSLDGRLAREYSPQTIQFSTQGLENGVYILQAIREFEGVSTTKVIIEN